MGHHLNENGKFQSDKFPDLPEGYVAFKIADPANWPQLELACAVYRDRDAEFAADLRAAMKGAGWRKAKAGPPRHQALRPLRPLRLLRPLRPLRQWPVRLLRQAQDEELRMRAQDEGSG